MQSTAVGLARSVSAAVIRNGVQRAFVTRARRARFHAKRVVIASPWLSSAEGKPQSLRQLLRVLSSRKVPTYVCTRPPQSEQHLDAITILRAFPNVELVFNRQLHAKIYACVAPPPHGFAILGSANLTITSESLYEIGVLIGSSGGGEAIVRELASFGFDYLRTRPDSDVVKRIDARSMRE